MTNDKIKILKDLKLNLSKRLSDNLIDVILFGSQLSDNTKSDSDYDVLVLIKNKTNWKLEREISDICYDLELKYGILTDTHILSESDLDSLRGKQPIFINAINQGFHA